MLGLRARYLAAMGLPAALVGCPSAEHQAQVAAPIEPPPTPTSSSTSTSWEVPYSLGPSAPSWCATGTARCSLAATCAPTLEVDCGCTPGAVCPGHRMCEAPLEATVGRQETAKQHANACCYELPRPCVAPWQGRGLDVAFERRAPIARGDWLVADDALSRRAPPAAIPWAQVAESEHASIASFARVSLELLALGAPPDLVRDTHLAAIDEIEHARFAYAMASAQAGRPLGPRPLPVAAAPLAPPSFAHLAERTFLDACLGETIGAEILRRRGEVARDPRLLRVAHDEERHAALAWRTLAWAVREGGAEAAAALESARANIRVTDGEERAIAAAVVLPCVDALLEAVAGPPSSLRSDDP